MNVGTCLNKPTIHQLVEVLANVVPIDRTSINAREDVDFVAAIKATGRQKLIIVALWTEVCLVFPALDALREGYGGLPSGRRGRGDVGRSPSRGAAAHRAGRGSARQLDPASLRTAARLEPEKHGQGFAKIVFAGIDF